MFFLENYIPQFLKNLNTSLGPTPKEMLKFLHFSDPE